MAGQPQRGEADLDEVGGTLEALGGEGVADGGGQVVFGLEPLARPSVQLCDMFGVIVTQAGAEDVVIVIPAGVAGDLAARPGGGICGFSRRVAQGGHDDAAHIGEDGVGVLAGVAVAVHVVHGPGVAAVQPLAEAAETVGGGGVGDAGEVEAEVAGLSFEPVFQVVHGSVAGESACRTSPPGGLFRSL